LQGLNVTSRLNLLTQCRREQLSIPDALWYYGILCKNGYLRQEYNEKDLLMKRSYVILSDAVLIDTEHKQSTNTN
jgi:hypothetical protein